MNRYVAIGVLVVILAAVGLFFEVKRLSEKVQVLSSNQTTLISGVKHSMDSLTARVGGIEVTTGEFKKLYPDLVGEIKALGIPIRQVANVSKVGLEINAKMVASVVDSVIGRDSMIVQQFSDEYIKYMSTWNPKTDSAKATVELPPVNISITDRRYKEGFVLFKPFKRWKHEYVGHSDNKYVKIGDISIVNVK